MKKKILLVMFTLLLFSAGCSNALQTSIDPTERGLGSVAAAIVTGSLIRAIFNQ